MLNFLPTVSSLVDHTRPSQGSFILNRVDQDPKAKPQSEPKSTVHWAIKAWFIFHCFAIITRAFPLPNDTERATLDQPGLSPIKAAAKIKQTNLETFRQKEWLIPYYTETLGFWQYWDMFAPNPAQEDIYPDAIVEYTNGETAVIHYPRMHTLSIPEKYITERYRKYNERMTPDNYRWKWPHTAHWFAAQADTKPGNPPYRVILRRNFYLVPPPPGPVNKNHTHYEFYTCYIDPTRLKEFKP